MEVVARRKNMTKVLKYEPFFGSEVVTGPQTQLWRTWTFCLLLGCAFTVMAGLWGHWSSYMSQAKTTVTVRIHQLSKMPLTTSEGMGIPYPDPMPSIYVQDAVLFPDGVMLLVKASNSVNLEGSIENMECRFGVIPYDPKNKTTSNVISIKPRTKDLMIVRCGRVEGTDAPSKFHSNVSLGIRDSDLKVESNALYSNALPSWDTLVYESLIDSNTLVLLAKGLVTKSSKRIDVRSLKCVFLADSISETIYETSVLTAAQEVIRCKKPPADWDEQLRGLRVSIEADWLGVLPSVTYYDPENHPQAFLASFLPSSPESDQQAVAAEEDFQIEEAEVGQAELSTESQEQVATLGADDTLGGFTPKRKLCACTMVWNKAPFLREWVKFHNFMGVEQYFVYDNDSDDDTEEVLDSLAAYNISRMSWPWIKTQQAAFSHCTILARDQCEWMLFTDVDEYIYPYGYLRHKEDKVGSDKNVFHRMIDTEIGNAKKKDAKLAQLQFDCNNFGPSGLKSSPKQGVTVGYTCRVKTPLRHKSIIRLDALDDSLLNVLHHFEIQEGYQNVKLSRRVAVCNHYKFQAWDAFKMKFVRRAGTYTTDWQKAENTGSKDRTPGLGTEAVKPGDWESRFCEVHDTGLRDFTLRTFAVPGQRNRMIWQVDGEEQRPHIDEEQPPHSDGGNL